MRQAGAIPNESDAHRFADFLLTQGIKSRVDATENGCVVWIKDEKYLEQGRRALAEFLTNPTDGKYQLAEHGARAVRKDLELKEQQFRRNLVDVRKRWRQPITGRAPITLSLIALSIVASLAGGLNDRPSPVKDRLHISSIASFQLAQAPGAGGPSALLADILHGQVWRLVTPIFLHFSLLHILFNLLMLQNMGTIIETREGHGRFLLLVIGCAIVSNLAQYFGSNIFNKEFLLRPLGTPIAADPFFGGMSGVVYALFGYLWLRGHHPGAGYYVHPNTVFMMLFWLVLCMTGAVGHVANTAHAVGLMAGAAGGWLANRR